MEYYFKKWLENQKYDVLLELLVVNKYLTHKNIFNSIKCLDYNEMNA